MKFSRGDSEEEATLMFQNEILAVFSRWLGESDLDVLQMAEASVAVINKVCGEGAIEFDADPDLNDAVGESGE